VNNNIMTMGEQGWVSPYGGGAGAFNGATFVAQGNVLANLPLTSVWSYPAGSSVILDVAGIGFSSLSGGDYSLSASSKVATAGVSGTTPGADMSVVLKSTALARAMSPVSLQATSMLRFARFQR
jgi:hypothetical protein